MLCEHFWDEEKGKSFAGIDTLARGLLESESVFKLLVSWSFRGKHITLPTNCIIQNEIKKQVQEHICYFVSTHSVFMARTASYQQTNLTLSPSQSDWVEFSESSAAYFLSSMFFNSFQLSDEISARSFQPFCAAWIILYTTQRVQNSVQIYSQCMNSRWHCTGRARSNNTLAIKLIRYFIPFHFLCSHSQLMKKKTLCFRFATIRNHFQRSVKQRDFQRTRLNECTEALKHNVQLDLYARILSKIFIHSFSLSVVSFSCVLTFLLFFGLTTLQKFYWIVELLFLLLGYPDIQPYRILSWTNVMWFYVFRMGWTESFATISIMISMMLTMIRARVPTANTQHGCER